MYRFSRVAALASAACCVVALTSVPASAVQQSCSVEGVNYRLSDATGATCFTQNNDTNTIDALFEMFGMTGWILADKSKEVAGDQKITFADNPTNGEAVTATWGITDWSSLASKVVITLKQSNSFAAFLLGDGVTSGTWGTDKGLSNGGQLKSLNGLSHGSIYYIPGASVSQVPLPAALPLLFGALTGLGFIGWRRKAA